MRQIVEPTKEEHDLACALSALEGLSSVPDGSISYDEFFRIIAAAKSAGVDDADIHSFCSKSQKYRPNEIQKKIESFKREGGGVTVAFLIAKAKELGVWSSPKDGYRGDASDVGTTRTRRPSPQPSTSGAWPKARKINTALVPDIDLPGACDDFQMFCDRVTWFSEVFPPDLADGYDSAASPLIGLCPATTTTMCMNAAAYVDAIVTQEWDDQLIPYDVERGMWCAINPFVDPGGSRSDANVADFRHMLIEVDKGMTAGQSLVCMIAIGLPVTAYTTSGNKSVHALVRIDADSDAQYRERVRTVFSWLDALGFPFDPSTGNPSRLTRPAGFRRGGSAQRLLGVHSHDEGFSWQKFRTHMLNCEGVDARCLEKAKAEAETMMEDTRAATTASST